MSQGAAAIGLDVGTARRSGTKVTFIRHFIEMLVVMFAGMGVLGGVAMLAFDAAGSNLAEQSGALRVALMGVYMTVPMVLWMAYRGHNAARNAEMAASMIVPTVISVALVLAGALETTGAMIVEHSVMVPAMLGVMLWRYDEYAHSHRRG